MVSAAMTRAGGLSSERFYCQNYVKRNVRRVFHTRPLLCVLLLLTKSDCKRYLSVRSNQRLLTFVYQDSLQIQRAQLRRY
jgi:hypothetical protein